MDQRPRDRLRELLDAVLDEEHRTLHDMAGGAYSSPFHFSRQLTRRAGEPPVAMRRRVMLERAAWQIGEGTSVTAAAFAAGYESVEGFSRAFDRAFGHPPSQVGDTARAHWLSAPNGIHFHPPMSLWVDDTETTSGGGARPAGEVTALMVRHDLDDVRTLLEAAKGLSADDLHRVQTPGHTPLGFDGPDETLAQVLTHLVVTKEVWLASVEGASLPDLRVDDATTLLGRHDAVAPRWLATVRDIDRRGAWGDRLVDALCDPPESFVIGSVVAHVLTYSAHRRELARLMLRNLGADAGTALGDPISWLRAHHQAAPPEQSEQSEHPEEPA